jgi:hypothetical protein
LRAADLDRRLDAALNTLLEEKTRFALWTTTFGTCYRPGGYQATTRSDRTSRRRTDRIIARIYAEMRWDLNLAKAPHPQVCNTSRHQYFLKKSLPCNDPKSCRSRRARLRVVLTTKINGVRSEHIGSSPALRAFCAVDPSRSNATIYRHSAADSALIDWVYGQCGKDAGPISPLRRRMHCREMPRSCSYRRMRRASVSVTSDTAVPCAPARAVRPTL